MSNQPAAVSLERHASRKRKMRKSVREAIEFYCFVSPWFIIFILLGLIPLLYGLYLSFTNFTGFNSGHLRFVGFRNYDRIFTDSDSIYALGRTFFITAVNVPLGMILGFLIAVLLNNSVKGVGIFRTIFYLPSIIPAVAVGLLWRNLLAKGNGLINELLGHLGIPAVDWLGYDHATLSLIILLMWGSGGGLIIYLAGLKSVPKELYESAEIDGASAVQRFRGITIPLMTPVLFFNLIMGIIGSLQIFVQPIMLTQGTNGLLNTPLKPNYLYLVHAFQQIFAFQRYGYGLALLWLLFVIILVFTLVVFKTSRYWVHYEVDQEGR
ncbi:carbohydrate ABC transporter permease [Paenibacillus humicola]|uniref:carbohydrate ABC transporter permease n=1 Tax=Paenibacillus humicola TaxID=3110540 RepID=UPI00237BD194|nr:sugar ABC transporter permease [Paenibacillus humicola]